MASTSASSVQKRFKYDVFLSFRGEDVRKTFVDHLYLALDQKGILTYKDDEKIEKGERISDQLIRSMKDSRFFIIVFSKNYASSSWCLDELGQIMECQRTNKQQTAYPVFYDVEPTEVRNQSGAVEEAFAKHVEKKVAGRWRDALKEAADLAGWELKTTFNGHEAKFIQKIVRDISLMPHFFNSSVDEKLVGMGTRVQNILSSLEIDSDDIRIIGIKGMGGGGKTTMARAVFDHISGWFEGNSFVENVREVSKGSLFGLKKLQEQVLSAVLNDQSIVVASVSDGKSMMKKVSRGKKVLVVLDDVDDIEQLEALAGELTWFKPGSRIIITTRDRQVLVAHGVNFIHDVNLLSNEEAIFLLSRYAFRGDIPFPGYEELSRKVVHYAAGLPLTIKVLGSHLYGRSELEWVDAINRLKTIPLKETLEKLELSYNGLENDQKEIFLDVVCILKGENKDNAIRILQSCGYNAQIGLSVLEQKSLITIHDIHGHLGFHDHIEEMAWNIVRHLNPNEPSRHSRLWIMEEIEKILVNKSVTEAKSIRLQLTNVDPTIIVKGLRNMKKLRLLFVHDEFGTQSWKDNTTNIYLPDALQSLCWCGYPFRILVKAFKANMLVKIGISWNIISQPREVRERKVLNKLRFVDLSYSELRTFDLSMIPHLEVLDLERCVDFEELHMPVECPNLKVLNLCGSKVSNLNLGLTPLLEELNLERCSDFEELDMPVECPNLKVLNLCGSKVGNLNLGLTPHLEELNVERCSDFEELHMPVECPNLKVLNLRGSKVSNLNLGLTPHLEELNLEGCSDFVELHMPVVCPNLKVLNLNGSKVSKLNLGLTPHLEELYLEGCSDFVELHMTVEFPNLKILNLSGSKVNNVNLGMTLHLEELNLKGCSDFEELHIPVECPSLKVLNLSCSKVSNLNLGMTPHLEKLDLSKCYCLQEIRAPVGCLKKLVYFCSSQCLSFRYKVEKQCLNFRYLKFDKQFINFRYLKVDKQHDSTNLDSIDAVEITGHCIDVCPLHPTNDLPRFRFTCKYDEPRSSRSGNIEKLFCFSPCVCENLEYILSTICDLQHLRELRLEESVPQDLWRLESLEKLYLKKQHFQHLPDSICMLKHLKSLQLFGCLFLEQLPENISELGCLEDFIIRCCESLRGIPNSICKMKCLKCLDLTYCVNIMNLPEEIGNLECLEVLDIKGTGISRLPQSIYQLKGLRIQGSREQLESYGFTYFPKEVSAYTHVVL